MEVEDYFDRFSCLRMRRDRGILELTLHTDGGPLVWGHNDGAHAELAEAFPAIAADPGNRVVILTGTGERFSGPAASLDAFPRGDIPYWETIRRNGVRLSLGLLEIDALVISCINGPALRHPEIPLLGDIVLAAEGITLQDTAHFTNRTVPGDGMNVILPLLMGYNRGRYFLLTGRSIDAREAQELGLVAEVLPREELLPRARALAEELIRQNPLVLRYTRLLFTHPLKKALNEMLGYGLALESLAAVDETNRMAE